MGAAAKSCFEARKTRKMNEQKDVPSITTRNDETGGERSSVIKEKDTAMFYKEIEGIMELTRIENGQLNKVDYDSLTEKTAQVILKNKNKAKAKCTPGSKTFGEHLQLTIILGKNMMMLYLLDSLKAFKIDTHLIHYG